jgi:hypothetical protein
MSDRNAIDADSKANVFLTIMQSFDTEKAFTIVCMRLASLSAPAWN